MGISLFVSFWTTRLVLNALGASDYGIFTLVGGAIAMLGFLNGSMAGATQRFMSYYQGKGEADRSKELFNISIVLHTVLAFVLVIALFAVGTILFHGILVIPKGRDVAAYIIYGSLVISTAFTVMSVPYDATLNAHENMRFFAVVGILESVLKLVVAFITVYTQMDKLIVYGVLMACIPICILTIMRVYCHRHYDECTFDFRNTWNSFMARDVAGFAGWNFFGSSAMVICNHGLGIVVNMFFGVLLNTALSIAQQISTQLKALSEGMLKAVNPVITKKAGEGNPDKMMVFAYSSTKLSFFLLAILVIPFFIETPYVLQIWLKGVPEWAVLFCRLQLIASILTTILGESFLTVLKADGNIRKQSLLSSITYMLSICMTSFLFYLRLPPWSMYISIILFNVIAYNLIIIFILKSRGLLEMSFFLNKIILPSIICLAISLILGYLPLFFVDPSFVRLIMVIIVSTISFASSFYNIVLSESERIVAGQIRSFVKWG